jgi:hypothetical protein
MISYRCLNKLEMEKIENFDFQIFLKAESTLYEKIQQLMKKLFDVYTYEIYFSSGWYDMLLIVHNISFLDIKNKIYELHSIDGKISTNTLILYKEA